MGDSIELGSCLPGGALPGPGGYMDMVSSPQLLWPPNLRGPVPSPARVSFPTAQNAPSSTTKYYFKEKRELAEGVCLDHSCMEAGGLLFGNKAQEERQAFQGMWPLVLQRRGWTSAAPPLCWEFSSLLTGMFVRKASLTCPGLMSHPKSCPDHFAATPSAGLSSH